MLPIREPTHKILQTDANKYGEQKKSNTSHHVKPLQTRVFLFNQHNYKLSNV